MITPEEIQRNIEATKLRRERNKRKAKNRKKGLQKVLKLNKECDHRWAVGGRGRYARIEISFRPDWCPRCSRRLLRYYRARTRSAEGEALTTVLTPARIKDVLEKMKETADVRRRP